jgi:hypothetical protein
MVGFLFSGSAFCCLLVATMPHHHPGAHMNKESITMARPSPAQEAEA